MSELSRFAPTRVARVVAVAWVAIFLASCTPPPPAPPRNVILISVDDLRADHLGCYGNPRDASPVLDAMARDGVRFDRAYSTAPWTLPSHMSMLTSLYPSEHGVNPVVTVTKPSRGLPILDEDVTTLPEKLHENGFATAAFTDGVYLAGGLGFAQGFDVYFENPKQQTIPPLRDHLFEWLRTNGDRRFFVFLHTFAVHLPFAPPAEALAKVAPNLREGHRKAFGLLDLRAIDQGDLELTPELIEEIRTLYDGAIRNVDSFVGAIREELARLGHDSDTLVILTSDHGEEFHEHGSFGHGNTLYHEALHVPLIFSGAGTVRGRTIEAPASTIDIMPTVLDLLGIAPVGGKSGRSLRPYLVGEAPGWRERLLGPEPRVLYAETAENGRLLAVLDGDEKAIHRASDDSLRIFDRRRDPDERHDLAPKREDLRKKFEGLVAAYRSHAGDRKVGNAPIDAELHEKLKALGYVAD